jgi:hypothetical protein
MDAIGQIPLAVRPAAPTTKVAAPKVASPEPIEVPIPQPDAAQPEPRIDLHTAEQRRLEAVERAARAAANTYVISDKTFTIFKDSTGQYITRFTSLRDSRVTYIPEPELLKSDTQAAAISLLDIKA